VIVLHALIDEAMRALDESDGAPGRDPSRAGEA
jgi:hypothetical protein